MYRPVALALALLPTAAGAVETMRIAMAEGVREIRLSGRPLEMGADAEDAELRALPAPDATVRWVRGRIEVDGAPVVGDALRFRAGTGALTAGEARVRGDVVVRLHGQALELVNVIPLEDYLAAVLGSEMPPGFPEEALKAQAVAARTYALQKKVEAFGEEAYLGASVLSQVYGGVTSEADRTRAAVAATRGEVLTFELAPIEAYFHASCGGRTESGLAALGRDLPYLKPVDCPCGKGPASSWELTLPVSEVERALGVRQIKNLAVSARTPTGRARRVTLGPGASIDAISFRQRLGYARLKSLNFEVEELRGQKGLRFTGHGSGHGAGLCQWGAKILAEQGWDYRRILAHYYPGTELQTLY